MKPPIWRDADTVCALADEERHFGHILLIEGKWHAFDATHLDEESHGFQRLGSFLSAEMAKQAVENKSTRVFQYAGAA